MHKCQWLLRFYIAVCAVTLHKKSVNWSFSLDFCLTTSERQACYGTWHKYHVMSVFCILQKKWEQEEHEKVLKKLSQWSCCFCFGSFIHRFFSTGNKKWCKPSTPSSFLKNFQVLLLLLKHYHNKLVYGFFLCMQQTNFDSFFWLC